ncbi:MAG: hypothetical protein HOQ24_11670 [Mycobacteriaceae bacterium]|nr:hypothetical protein [Mycobacteriaceae bacterium]
MRITASTRVGYGLWLFGAALSMFVGLLLVVASGFPPAARGFGVVLIVVAAVLALLATPARRGDVRMQRAAVALSMVFALFQVAAAILGGPALLLVAAVVLLAGGLAVYRANADRWVGANERGGGE